MKKNFMRKSFILTLCIIVLSLMLAGCYQTQGPAATSNNQAAASQPAGVPSSAGQTFVLKMQTVQGTEQLEFKMLKELADELLKASNGRLKVEVNPNGTFASSTESFTACMNGVFDVCANYGTWLKGVDYGLHAITTGNMQMDPISKRIWLYEFGGFELAQKGFDKANLQLLAMHTDGTEVLMARAPYQKVGELTGKKFRSSDTRLMAEKGIAGITMPLEELFTAFSTGAVDAAEYGYLAFNQKLGLTDVAKYGIWPDFWNVHNSISIAINKNSYNKLPADLQTLLKMAFRSYEFKHFSLTQFASAKSMKELEESGKLQFKRLNSEEFAEMRKIMHAKVEKADIDKYGGLTKEVYESQYNFMKVWYPYKKLSRWWGEDLTPEEMMGFNPKN